jgi:membrane fusion protein (multidrug efflux system)
LGRFRGFGNLGPTEKPVFDQYEANALVTEADLQKAQLQYEYTQIVAAEDGKIGKRNVETGELIQPGQALMALVEPDAWIEANFKEHQVSNIRVGQEVEVKVDAIPEHAFAGKVDSISPGSGSTFSLLPPDNATGNFTKIVQRIPVKIVLDKESLKGYEDRLVSGMSTEVTVKTW